MIMLKFNSPWTLALTSLMALTGTAAVQATSIIDTIPDWDGSSFVFSFGESNTATYGQTFVVADPHNILDSFTFIVDGYDDPDTVDFAAYVAEWDGTKAVGAPLFTSGSLSTTPNAGFETFTINTGGLQLQSGTSYVAFFSASNFFDGVEGLSQWAQPQSQDLYPLGGFVFQNNGNAFNALFTDGWDQDFLGTGGDLAFKLKFSKGENQVVPEPTPTLSLLVLSALGAGSILKRKLK